MSEEENDNQFKELLSGLNTKPAGTKVADRYIVESHLGGGGMGDVYLVKDTELKDEHRALKLIKAQFVSNETDLKRFQNEVRLTSRLDHPNIVRVFEYGVDKGELYYTMQYVKGKSLRQLLDANDNKIPIERSLEILTQLAKALEHAHNQKVVHRDLKPENIIIPDDGSPLKLTDFGLARSVEETEERLTKLDSALGGTAHYMSPEQAAESTEIDHRSDIYSFGILAYELMTGQVPFEGIPGIVKHMHREEPIPNAKKLNKKIPAWFLNIIEACTKKSKEERYQSFSEIVRVLEKKAYTFHWRSSKRPLIAILVSTLMTLATIYFSIPIPGYKYSGYVGRELEMSLLTIFYKIRGNVTPPDDVVIISLDDQSRDELIRKRDGVELNPFEPWPRRYHAEILEAIAPQKPKMVLFDIRFSKPREPYEDDERLVRAFDRVPTYIVRTAEYRKDKSKKEGYRVFNNYPHSFFSNKARGIYFANLASENGKIWRFKYDFESNDITPPVVKLLRSNDGNKYDSPMIREYINYFGEIDTIKTYQAYDALKKIASEELNLSDKYVVIGEAASMQSGAQVRDTFLTPASDTYITGEEVHATMLANVLKGNWLRRLDIIYEFLVILIVTIFAIYFVFIKAGFAILIPPIVSVLWLITAYAFFLNSFLLVGHTSIVIIIFSIVVKKVYDLISEKILKY